MILRTLILTLCVASCNGETSNRKPETLDRQFEALDREPEAAEPSSAASDRKPRSITVATWNVEWFFDDYAGDNSSDLAKKQAAPSRQEWEWKLAGLTSAIARMKPTILALQEVENRKVLRELTRRLDNMHGLKYRIAFIEGWDTFTEQDVAVIYRGGLIEYSCREQTAEMFDSRQFYNLNKHLFCQFQWGEGDDAESLTLLNVHLRAMPEKHALRQKQCKLIRAWLEQEIARGENIMVVGDLNTEEQAGSISPGSDLSILCGLETAEQSDDLADLNQFLPPNARATFQAGQQFDRILASRSLIENAQRQKDLQFDGIVNRGDLVIVGDRDRNHFNQFYEIPQQQRDYSDHYPVMAEFLFR